MGILRSESDLYYPRVTELPSAGLRNTFTFVNIKGIYTFIMSNLTTELVLARTKTIFLGRFGEFTYAGVH